MLETDDFKYEPDEPEEEKDLNASDHSLLLETAKSIEPLENEDFLSVIDQLHLSPFVIEIIKHKDLTSQKLVQMLVDMLNNPKLHERYKIAIIENVVNRTERAKVFLQSKKNLNILNPESKESDNVTVYKSDSPVERALKNN
jgi:hypothetical protein